MAKFAKSLSDAEKILKNLKESFDSLGKKEIDEVIKRLSKGKNNLNEWNDEISNFSLKADEIASSLDGVVKSMGDALSELQNTNEQLNVAKRSMRSISSIAREAVAIKLGEQSINEKSLNSALSKLQSQKRSLKLAMLSEKISKKERLEIAAQLAGLDDYKTKLEGILKTHEKTNAQLGVAPGILGGIDKQLQKLGFPDLGIADAVDETQKLNQAAGGTNGILKTWGIFSKALVKNLSKSLTITNLLQVSIGGAFALIKEMDSEVTDFSANMGVTNAEARATKSEMQELAKEMGGGAIRSDILMKSQMAIGKEIGTNAKLNKKDLVTMNRLVNQGKLRMETAAKLQKLTLLTGKSLDKTTKEILGAAKAQSMKNGLVLNEMDILEDVANISDLLATNLGENPKRLAEAAVTARKFGISLGQAESMSRSLLDFESSIQNELEAELLTGKSLNFEKARGLALAGESDKAAAAMLEKMSATEFKNMKSIVAQDALAKSMGMTTNELAESLRKKEALIKMGAEEGQSEQQRYNQLVQQGKSHAQIIDIVGSEEQANMLKKQGIQDRFNDSMYTLKEIVSKQLMPLFEKVAGFLEDNPKAIINTIKAVGILALAFIGIKTTMAAINGLQMAGNALTFIRQSYENGIMATLGLQKAAYIYNLAINSEASIATATRAAMEQTILGTMISQGVKWVYNIGLQTRLLGQKVVEGVINGTILTSMAAIGAGMVRNIASGVVWLGTLLAQAAAALATNAALTFGIGAAIAVGATIAAYAAIKSLVGNDVMSPGEGTPGYGKRTLMGPEGAIKLNNKDTVLAGTKLFGDDTVSEPGNPTETAGKGEIKVKSEGSDMSAVIEAINSLAGRPISIQIDGKAIAIATEDGNPRAMGDNRRANSYQIN